MTEPELFEAVRVETLKGGINEDGQFAIIRAVRQGTPPPGSRDIDLAIRVDMLPKVLGLVLNLIEKADAGTTSSKSRTSRRRCFEATTAGAATTADGRPALTFELMQGGKISIAIDQEQARQISESLAPGLDDHSESTASGKPH